MSLEKQKDILVWEINEPDGNFLFPRSEGGQERFNTQIFSSKLVK
jgi:hypothetical protein